jgi:hypothetical protein
VKLPEGAEVTSFLTIFTGLTAARDGKKVRTEGQPLVEVITKVKSLLGPNVHLVGQNVASDIKWLTLTNGIDYKKTVNLADEFKRALPNKPGRFTYYGLQDTCNALLEQKYHYNKGEFHSASKDAANSIRLYNKYVVSKKQAQATAKLKKFRRTHPSVNLAREHNFKYEGVCLSGFNPAMCSCDQASLA